ncbi:MAG: 30S ribosomal protein S4e [Candidatus Nanohalarchaeota archaeon]|nr:MAG: 30S ribosomal protein S4e [Candidatus Nanohaloarchaeota archaeon]
MHLKRLAAPKHFPIRKKEYKFTTNPRAGPHQKKQCIPIQIILRDILKVAATAKEAKKILKNKDLLIDEKSRKDPGYPVGLMDVIAIPKTKKYYRIIPKKGKLTLIEIPKEKSTIKLCKITGKTTTKNNITQLNLHDSRNILIKNEKDAKAYKVGDTIEITLPDQQIKKHLKLEKGNIGLIIHGKHEGENGKIKEIKKIMGLQKNKATLTTAKKDIETLKDHIFVIGKDKPEITIE